MNLAATLLAFAAFTGLAAAADGAPTASGKFVVAYQPIYCVRAPCPPGTYTVSDGEKRVLSAKSVTVDTDEADLKAVFTPQAYFSGIAVEGDLWLQDGILTIRPTRVLPGDWKNEPALEAAATAEAPFKLTVVNKTGDVVREVYAAAASADHWGADRLTENLPIKGKVAIDLPAGDCVYDLRIVLGVRPAEEIRRQDLCQNATVTADRTGRIVDRVR